MSSVAAGAMKALISSIHPVLKDQGYRKRGNTFNRAVQPDGLVHVINFQMGAFSPPGTVEIPGLRPNLYGRFTINLGVWIPGIPQPGFRDPAERTGKHINEYSCQLRVRLGFLLPEQADTWWRLDTAADLLAADVTSAINEYALPWLARFSSWKATLAQLETMPTFPGPMSTEARRTTASMRQAGGAQATSGSGARP